ncbi:MAG: hypothetical protein ACK5WB_08780 [Phycisphaerales bacterium]|jgi:hypothetical protein|nr:hypothetical protein [Phycisphaeraceae bacterium]
MTTRTKIRSLTAAAMLAAPLSAFAQTNFVETEPNNAKTVANSFTMASGDTITGTSTGSSSVTTSTLATTADYYRIKTTPAALGIYRNRLIMNTANTGTMTFSLRGLSQSSGVINTASDASVATADVGRAGVTPSSARSLQYYSFGREEEVFVSVVGATATTQPYTITLERTPVTPVSLGTTIIAGEITLTNTPTNTNDTAIVVYDSNFNIINAADNNLRGINDDRPITIGTGLPAGLRRTYAPGTYYVAFSGSNQATNLANPTDDNFRSGARLDFPNAITSSRITSATDFNLRVSGANFTTFDTTGVAFPASDRGFQNWFTMVVNPNLVPTPPAVASASTDRPGAAGDTVTINVTITPGTNPTSSTLLVEGDLSALTGVPGLTTFTPTSFTTYTATAVVGAVTPGRKLLPITATDDLSRSGVANAAAVVATDLGTLTSTASAGVVPAAGEVAWFKFTTTSGSDACTAFDFHTLNNPPTNGDTVLGIFNAAGTLVASDDDFGSRNESLLSFGFASPARPYAPFTTNAAGQNGLATLPAGTYYAAVMNWATGFVLSTPFNASTASVSLNPLSLTATAIVGSLSPIVATGSSTAVFEGESISRDVTVTITPGACPTSTGLVVTGTGPSAEALTFSNTSGNIWTATVAGNPSLAAGTYPIAVNIADDQARTATATINYNVRALTNLGVIHGGSAQPVSGTSAFTSTPREGWFKFKTLAPTSVSNFVDVTTLGSVYAGGPANVNDSIAALYSSTGALLAQGDDNYAGSSSTAFSFGQAAPVRNYAPHTANFVGGQGALPAGTYYLGVAPYNFTNSRLANFVFSTNAAGTGTNAANIYNNLPCVNPADIADTDGNPSPDGVVDNGDFTAFFAAFFLDESDPARLVADLGNTDGLTVLDIGGGPDTTVDNGDFTAFFTYFFNGLCQP